MKLKEAIARIEELERRVRDLEARPVFFPMPYPVPHIPLPVHPPVWTMPSTIAPYVIPQYTITCGVTQ